MTGWRFVAEECASAGVEVHLAEPRRRGRARTASVARRPTSSTPGCCASCSFRSGCRSRGSRPRTSLTCARRFGCARPSSTSAPSGCSASTPCCFTTALPSSAGRSGASTPAGAASSSPARTSRSRRAADHRRARDHRASQPRAAALDRELERFARRQPGCRALMAHYGIGPCVVDRDPRRARRHQAHVFLAPGGALRRSRRHRPPVRRPQPRRPSLPPRLPGAALGRVRSGAIRGPPRVTRSRLLPRSSRTASARTAPR